MRSERVLVLGLGNLLAGDEGVGIQAIRRLENGVLPRGAELLDGGTGGLKLLSLFQEYSTLILIDAALDGQPLGTVTVRAPRFAREFPPSLGAHDLGLRDLLEAAQLLGPLPKIHLVTVSIERIDAPSLELSPPVRGSLPSVEKAVFRLLEEEARA